MTDQAFHIGLLTSDLSHGHGWAHYSLSLLRALQRAGVQVTVIAARNSPLMDDIPVYPLLPPVVPAQKYILPRLLQAIPAAQKILQSCTVIHATIEPYAPLGAWLAGSRPFFVTAHGSYIHTLPRRRWPAGMIYTHAFHRARVICVSRYTEQVAQAQLPGLNTQVVNNGVDAERFATLPPLTAPKRGPTVLATGAVKPRKGTLELVRALAVVRQSVPEVQGVILGDLTAMPEYVAQVQAEISKHDLQDCVQLLGHVPENSMKGWLGAADVFALPSMNRGDKFEGFGLAHLEASAAGLPVIGTLGCGTEDAIIDGVTGLLVAQDQVAEQLPAAIIQLLRDPVLAARMGAAGRDHARQQTWDHVAQIMMAIYAQ